MKIIYCIASLHQSGGTERVITTKINYLVEQMNYKVYVVMCKSEKTPFFPLSSKVELISLNITSKTDYCRQLSELLFHIRPDITICTGGAEISFLNRIKDGSYKILEFHFTKNFLINFVKGIRHLRFKKLHLLKVWWLQKKLVYQARKFDKVVGLTERDVKLWGNPSNMTFIYNPLSFRSVEKSTTEHKKIIAVGSFTPAKGMDQLVEAFGKIAYRFPEWKLSLFGSGQDYGLLKNLIIKYHIENQVDLNESCKDIAKEFIGSGIYAFPSRSDGFGLVLTEAMECGLPVVAFDCECGPREIVSERTGILVPPQDINTFARALERLMNDADLRKSMGQCAQKEVARFLCR